MKFRPTRRSIIVAAAAIVLLTVVCCPRKEKKMDVQVVHIVIIVNNLLDIKKNPIRNIFLLDFFYFVNKFTISFVIISVIAV